MTHLKTPGTISYANLFVISFIATAHKEMKLMFNNYCKWQYYTKFCFDASHSYKNKTVFCKIYTTVSALN